MVHLCRVFVICIILYVVNTRHPTWGTPLLDYTVISPVWYYCGDHYILVAGLPVGQINRYKALIGAVTTAL